MEIGAVTNIFFIYYMCLHFFCTQNQGSNFNENKRNLFGRISFSAWPDWSVFLSDIAGRRARQRLKRDASQSNQHSAPVMPKADPSETKSGFDLDIHLDFAPYRCQ